MQKRISELYDDMVERGLRVEDLDLSRKDVKSEMLQRLREFSLREKFSEGVPRNLERRLALRSPMLCFRFSDLKEKEQEEALHSQEWLAEEKFNGVRVVCCYDKDEGFSFFSRHESVVDFLPINVSHAVPIWVREDWALGEQVRIDDVESFVLDCELVSEKSDVGIGVGSTNSKLGAVVGLTNSLEETAMEVLLQQNEPFLFVKVFDLLEFNGRDWKPEPLLRRRIELTKLHQRKLPQTTFHLAAPRIEEKGAFFQEIVRNGGEGIVLKNINSPYVATTSRRRNGWVKLKRRMGSVVESEGVPNVPDLDVWIGGFDWGTKGKRHEGKVGVVHLFSYLRKESGARETFHLASVASMPDELRNEMTWNFEKFRGRVLTADGMSVSPVNLRLTHAVVDWNSCWREDKTPEECEVREKTLKENVI